MKQPKLSLSLMFAFVFVLLGTAFTLQDRYTAVRSTNDGATNYWKPSEGPCTEKMQNTKRPIKAISSAIAFYAVRFISGNSSDKESYVGEWQALQGNCPYQIEDIYESGIAVDLFVLSGLFIGWYIYRDKRSSKTSNLHN